MASEGRRYLVIRASRADSRVTTVTGREALQSSKIKVTREFWDFPKGELDGKETGLEAALRETKEEAGIEKLNLIPDFKETVRYFTWREGKPVPKFVVLFLAETETENVTLSWEHDMFLWLPYGEAYERLTLPQMKQALEKAEKFLQENQK